MAQPNHNPDATPLVGGGRDVPAAAEDVVQVEQPAGKTRAGQEPLSIWLFCDDEEPREADLESLPPLVQDDDNFAWIDLSDYQEQDLCGVAEVLDLHPAAIHTSLSQWQRPRLDVYGDQFFMTATVAHLEGGNYKVNAGELDIFVARNFVVSAHKMPLPLWPRIMGRARQTPGLMQRHSAYLVYIILDELLEHYETLEEELQGEIEIKEERALTDTADDILEDLLRFKRYAFALSQLADQHREVFGAFLKPDFPFVGGDEMPMYFRDLQNRLTRLLDDFAAVKDAVNGAFDIYVSHMTHRTNQIIKLLTVVSTVLLPTTVILAFFGTQFKSVSGVYSTNAFVLMVLIILVMTSGILLAFHRQGWL